MGSIQKTRHDPSGSVKMSITMPIKLEKTVQGFALSQNTTKSQIARLAIEEYLRKQIKEARRAEFAETIRSMSSVVEEVNKQWAATETEGWPE